MQLCRSRCLRMRWCLSEWVPDSTTHGLRASHTGYSSRVATGVTRSRGGRNGATRCRLAATPPRARMGLPIRRGRTDLTQCGLWIAMLGEIPERHHTHRVPVFDHREATERLLAH